MSVQLDSNIVITVHFKLQSYIGISSELVHIATIMVSAKLYKASVSPLGTPWVLYKNVVRGITWDCAWLTSSDGTRVTWLTYVCLLTILLLDFS